MGFKLPHDVVSACAKRDEPPSRRRPLRVFHFQIYLLSTTSSELWPTSARLCFFSVFSGLKIRVHSCHSWFLMNNKEFSSQFFSG